MGKELFGTDGIRGAAGEFPLDPQTIYAFGAALCDAIKATGDRREVLIGADTRESGPWIAGMVAGGIQSRGGAVRYASVVTTPAEVILRIVVLKASAT